MPSNPLHTLIKNKLLVCCIAATLAVGAAARVDFGRDVEQRFGLPSLLRLRALLSTPQVPEDIVTIGIGRDAFVKLKQAYACTKALSGKVDMRCLPRRLHGDLVETLQKSGATVIVFNLIFKESRGLDDVYLADKIRTAGNVVLQGLQEKRFIGEGMEAIAVSQPVAPLDGAAASAPFVVPDGNTQTGPWAFIELLETVDGISTIRPRANLPIAALHLLALRQFPQALATVLATAAPDIAAFLQTQRDAPANRETIHGLIDRLGNRLRDDPDFLPKALDAIPDVDPAAQAVLRALLQSYDQSKVSTPDFYGPPGTLSAIAYEDVHARLARNPDLFKGKVVFIGTAIDLGQGTKGGTVDTPFGEISSTELLATLFANLRDGRLLTRLPDSAQMMLLAAIGCALYWTIARLNLRRALLVLSGTATAWLATAVVLVEALHVWLAVFWPLALLSIGMALTVVYRYLIKRNELRTLIAARIPPRLLNDFARSSESEKRQGLRYIGVCLATDGEGYTRLGEMKGEQWLAEFMLAYQPAVENCIHRHGGTVKDWAGDGMVALWLDDGQPAAAHGRPGAAPDVRSQALLAALELKREIKLFNILRGVHFPLRIGIGYGPLWLAFDKELKAFGDTLNTARRLETLNKQLKTDILLAENMLAGLNGIAFRRVGCFQLRGHDHLTNVFEPLGLAFELPLSTVEWIYRFEQALAAYERQAWQSAIAAFAELQRQTPDDGPTAYYLAQCLIRQDAAGASA